MPKIRMWPVAALVLLAAAVALGVIVAHTDLFAASDQQISANLHHLDSGWVHGVASSVNVALSPLVGVAVVIVWPCALVLRNRRLTALSTFVTLCAGWGVALVLKHLVDRPRPPYGIADGPSYPSGHTALAVAIVFAAFFLVRKTDRRDLVVTVGTLLVALVMFSRVILGAHYLTDTVGAVLASSGAVVLATGIWHAVAPLLVRRFPGILTRQDTITSRPEAASGRAAAAATAGEAASLDEAAGPEQWAPHEDGSASGPTASASGRHAASTGNSGAGGPDDTPRPAVRP